MAYSVTSFDTDNIVGTAVQTAQQACEDISSVLADISDDNVLGGGSISKGDPNYLNPTTGDVVTGGDVAASYGATLPSTGLNISEASGAMVIDDLMQKISTKVQVASQLLSTANNIAKTASRILSQG